MTSSRGKFEAEYLAWEWRQKINEALIGLAPAALNVAVSAAGDVRVDDSPLFFFLAAMPVVPLVEALLLSLRSTRGCLGATLSEALRLSEFACARANGQYIPPAAHGAPSLLDRLAAAGASLFTPASCLQEEG